MKTLVTASFVVAIGLTTALARAEEKKAAQAVCPVSGQAIDKNFSTDYQGGKVYFCCGNCKAVFTAAPAKYAAKANLQLVATGQAEQTGCPITGAKTDATKTLTVNGVEVRFCCGGCQGKVAKAKPEEKLELVFGKGFAKGFTVKK